MNIVNVPFSLRKNSARVALGLFVALGMALISSAQQQPSVPLDLQNPDKILTIRADSQEKDKDIYRLRGHVEVTYRGMKLTADEVTYDEASGEVVGTGHVLFIDPRSHIAADEVHYNIRTQKGWFSNGRGFIHANPRARPKAPYTENPYYIQTDRSKVLYTENPFYIQGEKIERLDENTYTVKHGRFTTCDCESKGLVLFRQRRQGGVGRQGHSAWFCHPIPGRPYFLPPRHGYLHRPQASPYRLLASTHWDFFA